MTAEEKYKDIINMEHPTSKKHPRMDMIARAGQFAPFAALTGFSDELEETGKAATERAEREGRLQ